MKTIITHDLGPSLQLDGREVWQTTGRPQYGSKDYTITVERVRAINMHMNVGGRWALVPSVSAFGPTVLKAGGTGQHRKVEMPIDDPRVPDFVREALGRMADYRDDLNAIIVRFKAERGIEG